MVGYRDAAHEVLKLKDAFSVEDFFDGWLLVTGDIAHDVEFLLMGWVFHQHVEEEAVELSFGQWVSSFLLDRVLGGEHEEWFVEFVVDTTGGDALFLHRLEQSCLGLGRSTVDFVRE